VFIGGGLILSLAEAGLWLPPRAKTILAGGLILTALFFLALAVSFLIRIKSQPDNPSDEEVSLWVGRKFSSISDRLRNAVQLQQGDKSPVTGESAELRAEALRQTAPGFLAGDMSGVVDRVDLLRRARFLAGAMAGLLIMLIPSVREGFWRMGHFRTAYIKPPEFTIAVYPGDIEAVKGDTLEIRAVISGERVREVEFCWMDAGAGKDSRKSVYAPLGRDWSGVWKIEGVQSAFVYWVQAGGEKSVRYTVTVQQPPSVKILQVELLPPGYSGFPPMNLEANLGDFIALAGTQARFKVTADAELAAALLAWRGESGKDTVFLQTELNRSSGSRQIVEGGSYQIRLKDLQGLWNQYPIEYRVEILPDLPPAVEILQPGADLELSGAPTLLLTAEAEDDFSISRMELYYCRSSSFEADTVKEYVSLPVQCRRTAEGVFRGEYRWGLDKLELIPGDVVEYYMEVWDNDMVSGPKSGRSRAYILRLPTMAEMFKALDESEKQGLEDLKQSLERSQEVRREVEKAVEQMKRKGDLDWTEKRELDEKVKQQKEALEKLEAAKESLDEIMRKVEDSSLMSLELLQKYNELQKLMTEIADAELLKAMQKLQEALQQVDPEQLRQAAEMFQFSQEEMLKRIEKTLEIFKQLQLERQMDELAERAAEMAERQDDIADSLGDKAQYDTEDLYRQEQQLKADMEDFLQRMEETAALAEVRDSTAAGELSEMAEEGKELPGEMGEMSGQMKSGEKSKAEQKGRQISKELSKIAQGIKQSKAGMVSRKKDELTEQLMQSVRDLVTLSKLQEALKAESTSLSVQSPRFREQAGAQAGIEEGLKV